ncbi:tyrosine-type recombinase/integrase [Thiolinea disciformis]|uniref:tyrosine-type recombinase/integrase n=1 Tax=Thiolinea disciformis TaxID=125614 RepID=UPI000379EDCB|nr:site-specific integrase [Thiolinea disciformis]
MSLYKRGTTWWVRFTAPNGERVRESTGTDNKTQAQEYHDQLKAHYWKIQKLGEKPDYTWQQAVVRWLDEASHKATLSDDINTLKWLDKFLGKKCLNEINRNVIDLLKRAKQSEKVSNATVNRMLALVRAILRKAVNDWEWLDKSPYIKLLPEPKRRIRWLTSQQATRLLSALPSHIALIARFSLATGLRQRNAVELEWSQIDLERRLCWVHPDQAKARKAICVPLNTEALEVLQEAKGKHPTRVFTFKGKPVGQVTTKAWYRAVKESQLIDFRWHDLRHTWASWHVQNGTPLHVLQELGGWESIDMVRRYAHLGAEHLSTYAEAVCQTWHKSGTVVEN